MKVLPHGAIVLGSKGSSEAFQNVLEEVDENKFSGYLEVRMRIPGGELWGVVVFKKGRLIESYASRMGVDIFGENAYMYLLDLAADNKTNLTLHELDSDNILDFLMSGRGDKIKIEDHSLRLEPSSIPGMDGDESLSEEGPQLEEPDEMGMVKKLVLLGDPSVGKTSLTRRFVENTFDEAYLSTIGSNVNKKTVTLYNDNGGSNDVKLMIWDIAGDKACDSLKRAYYRGAHGAIIVCDITMEETFKSLPHWIESLRDNVGEVPTIILGNKSDLEEFRTVDLGELQEIAEEYGISAFLTSARTGENVEMVFTTLAMRFAGS
jgi:small GTP-binding protein